MSVYYLICPGTTSVNLVRARTWSAPRTYFCNSNDWVQSPQGRAHPSVSSIALSIFLAWTRFKRNVKCPTIPPPTLYGRKQTYIHTTSANAVTLVWGSLRLAPIIQSKYVTGCVDHLLLHPTYLQWAKISVWFSKD